MSAKNEYIKLGQAVVQTELEAIAALAQRIDDSFVRACELCFKCQGRIIVMGIGKSGHIARKIAATFASTGTPAFFVHPSEATHGDMGMMTHQDVLIAISNSGESSEILALLPYIKQIAMPLIVMTGKLNSTLAQQATAVLNTSVAKEACPLNLAPTSSTTACLVMGDALAISLLGKRGFTKEDFAQFHPGGMIGRRLLVKVQDVMRKGAQIPKVTAQCLLPEALLESSRTNVGLTTIVDAEDHLLGVFTDGDLRRVIKNGTDLYKTPIAEVMHRNPLTISPNLLAAEAYHLMQEKRVTCLVVVDEHQKVAGVVQMHDIMLAGIS